MPDTNNLRILALCAAIGGAFLTNFLADDANAQAHQRATPPSVAISCLMEHGSTLSGDQIAEALPNHAPDQSRKRG